MARVHLSVQSDLAPAEAFARLVNLDAHSAVIPFTTLTHQPPLHTGSTFVARTAIGPIGFDDPMIVTKYAEPTAAAPGRVTFRKTGRWVTGDMVLTVIPDSAGGSRVDWQQEIGIRWLPAWFDPVVGAVARLAYAAAVRGLLRRSPSAA